MIEAANCIFHKLLGEVEDDLDRVTPRLQESPCAEIKQNKQRCSRTVILKENPCPHSNPGTRAKVTCVLTMSKRSTLVRCAA